jgi:hypothetical protein
VVRLGMPAHGTNSVTSARRWSYARAQTVGLQPWQLVQQGVLCKGVISTLLALTSGRLVSMQTVSGGLSGEVMPQCINA